MGMGSTGRLTVPFAEGTTVGAVPLDVAGGKGVNLCRLAQAGFPVPPGFVLATTAYQDFVSTNGLEVLIGEALNEVADGSIQIGADVPTADAGGDLEAVSRQIRDAFSVATMPEDIQHAVRSAYAELGEGAVAVRSSATAEDLPDLSFAGQQDTFLNVIGADAVLRAVVDCWSSLWTARAIGYRARNDIPHQAAALAVVVQRITPAEVSGVLFTANPLTGRRDETVIDATFGLGEALVSGQVEPDHYVADSRTGQVREATLGAKATATVGRDGGGVDTRTGQAASEYALTHEQVRQLVELGQRVQREYGTPQDLEWALADETLWLLQARAITSLYPIPQLGGAIQQDTGQAQDALSAWASFGAVQGMLAPMTPLGRDAILMIISGGATVLGYDTDYRHNPFIGVAGERLWIRIDRALRHPFGRRLAPHFLQLIEPSVAQVVNGLLQEPGFAETGRPKAAATVVGRFVGRVLRRVPLSLANPQRARQRLDDSVVTLLDQAQQRENAAAALPDPTDRLRARIAATRDGFAAAFPALIPYFGPMIVPAMLIMRGLGGLVEPAASGRTEESAARRADRLVLEITRAVPNNVTTQMDLALWDTARTIRDDPDAATYLTGQDPQQLGADYLAGTLPTTAQHAISTFLDVYGMRGVAEIDFGAPRWREGPAEILGTIGGYLQLDDPDRAPDVAFQRGELAAAEAIGRLTALARTQRAGGLRAPAVRFLAERARGLIGARESPKFAIIRLMGILRTGLLASGSDLVTAGVLERLDDVFYLTVDELEQVDPTVPDDGRWRELVTGRRETAGRERRRRQIPRVILGDGRTFYEGLGALGDGTGLSGSPVSPGVAEGTVRVVFEPHRSGLEPGDILVCPGTDPAWTPLFLTAGGLITEVGGMMTHGSVVAREYGIPAVVGVHEATRRLLTGQRIRIDGTTGTIEILDHSTQGE